MENLTPFLSKHTLPDLTVYIMIMIVIIEWYVKEVYKIYNTT